MSQGGNNLFSGLILLVRGTIVPIALCRYSLMGLNGLHCSMTQYALKIENNWFQAKTSIIG